MLWKRVRRVFAFLDTWQVAARYHAHERGEHDRSVVQRILMMVNIFHVSLA